MTLSSCLCSWFLKFLYTRAAIHHNLLFWKMMFRSFLFLLIRFQIKMASSMIISIPWSMNVTKHALCLVVFLFFEMWYNNYRFMHHSLVKSLWLCNEDNETLKMIPIFIIIAVPLYQHKRAVDLVKESLFENTVWVQSQPSTKSHSDSWTSSGCSTWERVNWHPQMHKPGFLRRFKQISLNIVH